ncbi:uncharacterized protein [Clytia hemisphaerica]|uniref:AAA+ ATPase domain-containing protein n=1 Tax=Clytia hemisphaerica TaxID=252671 RepID=A0A7M5UZU0_9CNID|eukprot:TCONS_00061928-protein
MFASINGQAQLTSLLNETYTSIGQLKSCLCSRSSRYAKTKIKGKRQERALSSQTLSPTINTFNNQKKYHYVASPSMPKDWFVTVAVPNTQWAHNRNYSQWNVSHTSAETFFKNKVKPVHNGWTKKMLPNYSKGVNPIRWHSMYMSRSRLLALEDAANTQEYNAAAQAEYLKAILPEDPELVIRRYESGRFASNEEAKDIYMKALLVTNRLTAEEATRRFSNQFGSSNTATTGTTNTGWNIFANQGNKPNGTEDQPLHVIMNPKKGSFFKELVPNLLRIGLLVGVVMYGFTYMQTKMLNVSQKEILPDQSEKKFRFTDVQGCDEAKAELQEVVEFLKSPEKFERLGAKLPGGVLLIGPPGTGKTLLARAIAGEADVPFFFASGSEFDEMFVGVGASRVRKLFAAAKERAPCIIFIDELDAIGGTRVTNDHQPYSRMTLNQLLVELDGFDQTEGIIVIGATNFPEILDKALTRPGRFDSKVHVLLPDVRGRKEILNLYLAKSPVAQDVDSGVLARGTPGLSGADLYNLINQAALRAAGLDKELITMDDLEWAKDKIYMGPERKSAVIEEKNRTLVAFHESGHAIVAIFTPDASPVHKATVIPRGSALGYVMQLPEKDELSWSKKQLLAKMDVCMGGRVAEEMIFGEDSITTGASSDMQQATKIARAMVTQYGMSEKVGTVLIDEQQEKLSPELQAVIESEVKRLINEAYNRAKKILSTKAKEHKRLAEGLLKYETLNADELKLVIQGKALENK